MRQMCRMSGLSARALRFYDAQGLLKPAAVCENGYRMYDEKTAARARQILAYRSTGMPLEEIRAVLDSGDPEYARRALRKRLRVLQDERTRLDRMSHCARGMLAELEQRPWEENMNNDYAEEVQQRWENSTAFADYKDRLRSVGSEGMELAGAALMDILALFGELRGTEPDNPNVQEVAERLHSHISDNFYACSPEMLAGLGEMYVEDPRFRQNIDKTCGDGTAVLARDAIRVYCAGRQQAHQERQT